MSESSAKSATESSAAADPATNGQASSGSVRDRILRDKTKRPATVPVNLAGIPPDLRLLDRWLGWRWKWEKDKWTKVPKNCRGGPGSSTDEKTWCDLATALAAAEAGEVDGVGIALGKLDDGRTLSGVDLDECRNPDTGKLTEVAESLVANQVLPIYWDVSPTDTGIEDL